LIQRELGQPEEAYQAFSRAEENFRISLGPESHVVGMTTTWIGRSLLDLDRAREAAVFLQNGLDILTGVLGPDHPRTLGAVLGLGMARLELGDVDAAFRSFELAERRARSRLDREPESVAAKIGLVGATRLRGVALQEKGYQDEAVRAWQSALELIEPLVADSETVHVKSHYFALLFFLGRTQEARSIGEGLVDQGYREREFLDLWEQLGGMKLKE